MKLSRLAAEGDSRPMNLVAADVSRLIILPEKIRADSHRLLRFLSSFHSCWQGLPGLSPPAATEAIGRNSSARRATGLTPVPPSRMPGLKKDQQNFGRKRPAKVSVDQSWPR